MEEEEKPPILASRMWRTVRWPLVGVALFLVGLMVVWALWPDLAPAGTGFGAYNEEELGPRAKTLWDWLGLLIVPLAVAAGAAFISFVQKRTELDIAEKARKEDREIARQARESEQQIANDRLRQAALEAYYDRMTELLLQHGLRESAVESEASNIARARTVAVVKGLDGERKGQLLAFLKASGLIKKDKPIVDLYGVDLGGVVPSGANLSEANLRGAILCRADLNMAILTGANLSEADLCEADLREADLREASMSEVDLREANLLSANLRGADLTEAYLNRANLSGAKLTDANLNKADLREAYLGGVDLRGADLTEANLNMANLSRANLSDANLNKANLSGADLSRANLDKAILIRANLGKAHLIGVDLDEHGALLTIDTMRVTNLSEADLSRSDLSEVDLSEADLRGVVLSRANLTNAVGWTIEQFDQCWTGEALIMPDGVKLWGTDYPDGPTYLEWKARYLSNQDGSDTL